MGALPDDRAEGLLTKRHEKYSGGGYGEFGAAQNERWKRGRLQKLWLFKAAEEEVQHGSTARRSQV